MWSLVLLLLACGPKSAAPEAAAEQAPQEEPAAQPAEAAAEGAAAAAEEAAAGDEAAAAEEAPTEPAPPPPNADLDASIVRADGSTVSGHVVRIERSEDWYGEAGWTTEPKDLVISGESGDRLKDIRWEEVDLVTIRPGKVPDDVDCFYDSDYTPWMYDCTLKTTATVLLRDGSRWTVTNRHKWRFTFDDGQQVEFWLYKYPAREQDEESPGLDSPNPENYSLYTKLQQRLKEEARTVLVTRVDLR